MKTIVIWNEFGQGNHGIGVTFAVFDGDLAHLDGVYVNSVESLPGQDDEILDLFFNDEGYIKVELFEKFPTYLLTSGEDVFIIQAGFLP